MNKIVFGSENKRMIEKITAILNSRHDLNLQLLSTSQLKEALDDIRFFKAEVIVLDALYGSISGEQANLLVQAKTVSSVSKCIILTDDVNEQWVCDSEGTLVGEYVIYDEHMEQLFNKLSEYQNILYQCKNVSNVIKNKNNNSKSRRK